jgi:hypothetical protein
MPPGIGEATTTIPVPARLSRRVQLLRLGRFRPLRHRPYARCCRHQAARGATRRKRGRARSLRLASHRLKKLVISNLPDHLDEALSRFETKAGVVAGALQGRGSDYTIHQFIESASDVVAAGRLLGRAQRRAAETLEETATLLSSVSGPHKWVIPTETAELEDLRIAWKGWFLFVRAFCDLSYRVILAAASGSRAPRGGSLATALAKPSNPVRLLLDLRAPSVLPWFRVFRDRRNDVKSGVNFSFTAIAKPGVAITFNVLTIDRETGRRSLHLGSDTERELPFSTVLEDVDRLIEFLAAAETEFMNGTPDKA